MPDKHTYSYRTVELHDKDERIQFQSVFGADQADLIAEDAATHFHNEQSGWEVGWPLDFEIYDDTDKLLGVWTVERETVPVFIARRKAVAV